MFGREDERLGHPLFTERWSNRKAFKIGVYAGQGYSAPAIANRLADGVTSNVISTMLAEWGFRLNGDRHTYAMVKVPVAAQHRTLIAAAAERRDTTMQDLMRQVEARVATDDLYQSILDL